ncbi:S41 family peptidase [Paenibacillus lentus]|uniref:S41 family peptidase n=1 Tax=Paenibacillus lentus TaxID=1338368 RepID=A0A3Q8S4F2_9BACL|nr:S41 family peptidase [Paenibacillus lentus]AZK46225.1 S41 family peptidase [Paenibacillus lentus]
MIKSWYKAVLIPLLFLTLCLPQAAYAESPANEATEPDDLEILREVLQYLNDNNIEGVRREEFIENAIRGMVHTLEDPYSDYFTQEELQEFEDQLNQEYVGIGALIRFTQGKLYVTEVLEGSPAKSAGLRKGDIIAKVDDHQVTSAEDIHLIHGEENTKVNVTIKRGGSQLSFMITRAHFALPSVSSRMISSGDIGYIAISTFSDQADEEFAAHLNKLRKLGMKSLVLDLRDNLGGYVESAQNITKHFIKDGVLMYTESQNGKLEAIKITKGSSLGMPVVILTNEWTASASEILTAALRDNGIATVVGTQTYGKARIQNIYSLSNGGSLKLTILKYLTPNREDFNYIGLEPDIEVNLNPTAQLIVAMHEIGLKNFEVSGNPSELNINNVSFTGYLDVVQEGNKVYAQSRVLAALVQGNASWATNTGVLTITDNSGKQQFKRSAGSVKILNDETYIELQDFQKKYPAIEWSYQQDTLKLKVQAN